MNNLGKKAEVLIIIVIIALIGIVYAITRRPVLAPTISQTQNQNQEQNQNQNQSSANPQPSNNLPSDQELVPRDLVEYRGMDGRSAFEILKLSYNVESQHYSFGDMVTSINGIKPDSNHFWAMYVNGQFSQVGASQYMTKSSDTIKWQIDKIEN
jgi:hypothetical protein